MPRMSKSKKLEWSFFLNDRGRKAYNTLCRHCVHDCKQSFPGGCRYLPALSVQTL